VKPPRVKESAVSLECELHSFNDIESARRPGERACTLIIGLVKRIHVRTDVLDEKGDAIDPFKLKPVVRMGSGGYGKFEEGYVLTMPTWDAKKDEIEQFYKEIGGGPAGTALTYCK
jgi:flavin reductase (DIM6/NTAB) family NADH-FMN oxidoreductase RutF